jgi:prevent-host-death family protein
MGKRTLNMRSWDLAEAAGQLEQVIDEVGQLGPQFITRQGQRVAVMISFETYVELKLAHGMVQHFEAASLIGLVLDAVGARSVRFDRGRVYVELTDGRELGVPIDWYEFLRDATPITRDDWEIDAQGLAVYWPQLQDGLEVLHLLDARKLAPSGP